MRVLNIGCGKQLDIGTDWIDVVPRSPKVLKVDASRDRFPYKDGTFDTVYARGVLEFIPNPEHFFEECRRVLKRGGTLKLITPNATGIDTVLGHNSGYNNPKLGAHQPAYFIFTQPILRNWLVRYGFREIRMRYETGKLTEPTPKLVAQRYAIIAAGSVYRKLHSQIVCEAKK